jgi:hypothetical protein
VSVSDVNEYSAIDSFVLEGEKLVAAERLFDSGRPSASDNAEKARLPK